MKSGTLIQQPNQLLVAVAKPLQVAAVTLQVAVVVKPQVVAVAKLLQAAAVKLLQVVAVLQLHLVVAAQQLVVQIRLHLAVVMVQILRSKMEEVREIVRVKLTQLIIIMETEAHQVSQAVAVIAALLEIC